MLTQDNDLRKKFEGIMLKADRVRENPTNYETLPLKKMLGGLKNERTN